MPKEKVVFQSYNPYQAICPATRVVSLETLYLIKMFRSKGIEVSVEPEDGAKLCYLAKKGWQDIFTDPIFLKLSEISLSIALNLISSWLYDILKISRASKQIKIPVVIETEADGQKAKYAYDGQPISNDYILEMLIKVEQDKSRFATPFSVRPNAKHSFPVYLEHTNRIIGQAKKFSKDSKGLLVEGTKITDDSTWQRIQNGELKGLSIAGVITSSECSICKKEYVECNHFPPNVYHGKHVSIKIESICIAEVSIVREPKHPLAQIKLTH